MEQSRKEITGTNQASFFQDYAQRASQWASSILSNLMTANVKNDDKFYLDFWRCVLTQVDDIDTIEALTLTCKSVNKSANERAAKLLPQMARKAMQVRLSGSVCLTRIDRVINELLVTEFNKINLDESAKQLVEVKQKQLPLATLKRIQSIRCYLEQIELSIDPTIKICFENRIDIDPFDPFNTIGRRPFAHRSKTVRDKLPELKEHAYRFFESMPSLEQYGETVSRVQKELLMQLDRYMNPPEFMEAEFAELKNRICSINVEGIPSQSLDINKSF